MAKRMTERGEEIEREDGVGRWQVLGEPLPPPVLRQVSLLGRPAGWEGPSCGGEGGLSIAGLKVVGGTGRCLPGCSSLHSTAGQRTEPRRPRGCEPPRVFHPPPLQREGAPKLGTQALTR